MKRWKRIVSLMLTLGMLLSCVPGSALAAQLDTAGEEPPEAEISAQSDSIASGYCGGEGDGTNLTWVLENGVLTISGTGAMADYDKEDAPWAEYADSINALVLMEGITTIGNSAFESSRSTSYAFTGSLIIPDSVTEIGESAFEDCDGFNGSLTIGENVGSIGGCAFAYCSFTGDLIIPDSVVTIGSDAFSFCDFTGLSLGSQVATIGSCAFELNNFTGTVFIPAAVSQIGKEAFMGCRRLADFKVDENNANYSSDAYGVLFNKDQTELIQYPADNSRSSYTIPDGVTVIADEAFYWCEKLTGELIIPESVTTIGTEAFCECYHFIGNVEISKNITFIGARAFDGCSGLESFTVDSENTNYSSDAYGVLFNKDKTELLQYPAGNSRSSYEIPDGVKIIGECAFEDCSNLTGDLLIPESVITIGDSAFWYCTGFTSVKLSANLQEIDNWAFASCTGLSGALTVPAGVTEIGRHAFEDCTGLTGVYFMGDAPNVLSNAFPENMTLYYFEGKTGWTDSKDYDENAGTWNGYKLEVWSGLVYGGVGTETLVTYDPRDGSVTIENVPEDTSVVVAAYLDERMIDGELAVTSTVETVSLTLKKASGADEFRVFQTDSGYSPTATAIQLSLTK